MAIHALNRSGNRRLFLGETSGPPPAITLPYSTGLLMQIDVPSGLVWKDTGRSIPATAVGDTVLGVTDRCGAVNHWSQGNSSLAPTLQLSSDGKMVLRFPNDGAHYMSFVNSMSTIRTVYWVISEDQAWSGYNFMLGHGSLYDFHSGDVHACFDGNSAVNLLRIDKAPVAIGATRPATLKVVTAQTSRACNASEFSRDRNNTYRQGSWRGDLSILAAYSVIHTTQEMSDTEDAIKNYMSI